MSNFLKNKKLRTWGIVAAAILVVVLATSGFLSVSAKSAAASAEGAKVTVLDMAETVSASGSLAAQPFASLTWKTDGTVKSVNVKPGDQVKAGDILVGLQAVRPQLDHRHAAEGAAAQLGAVATVAGQAEGVIPVGSVHEIEATDFVRCRPPIQGVSIVARVTGELFGAIAPVGGPL